MAHGILRSQPPRRADIVRALAAFCGAGIVLAAASPRTAGAASSATTFDGISLKIRDSSAAPGGVMQLVAGVTEPTPILTASTTLSFDAGAALGPVLGVALFGLGGSSSDASGAAVVGSGQITLRTVSPGAEFGADANVPIFTVSVAVSLDAAIGAEGTVSIDPARSLWIGPSGDQYPQLVENGSFKVAASMSIDDVVPSLGVVPAGSTISVLGRGFQPGAVVDADEVVVASTEFVSDAELRATLAGPADMYGRKVKVKNPDLSLSSYWTYPRTAWLARSARPLLAATEPVFCPQTFSSASFTSSLSAGQFLALAIQNPGEVPASVTVDLSSAAGRPIASTALTLPARTRISREVSELFAAIAAPADALLVVRSSVPVQMLALVGEDAAGSVVPLVPALALP
jgi:hypothetical protein